MRRVRSNVETLVELLPAYGYEFDQALAGGPPFSPPDDDITDRLNELEAQDGVLPLSLRSWYEHVGNVNFAGRHPDWTYDYIDELTVDAPIDFVLDEHAMWTEDQGTEYADGPFAIPIAPDWLHKADLSGGPPYGIEVPNGAVDGVVLWEPHQTTFVNYLRTAFHWAGFPGWSRGFLDGWSAPPPVPDLIVELRTRLQRI